MKNFLGENIRRIFRGKNTKSERISWGKIRSISGGKLGRIFGENIRGIFWGEIRRIEELSGEKIQRILKGQKCESSKNLGEKIQKILNFLLCRKNSLEENSGDKTIPKPFRKLFLSNLNLNY